MPIYQARYKNLPDVTILVALTVYNEKVASGEVGFEIPQTLSKNSVEMEDIKIPFTNDPKTGFIIHVPESWMEQPDLQGVIREISSVVIDMLNKHGVTIAKNLNAKF